MHSARLRYWRTGIDPVQQIRYAYTMTIYLPIIISLMMMPLSIREAEPVGM